ncbi:MAG: flagellar export chaperone FliS [Planctomycetes bacterium]|nr:flagellar export chaperone FliS [Planctomycetota bacterium]
MMNATYEYTKNSVMTASRAKLVVMMYDGAIRFAEQARFQLKRNNHAACGTAISNCYNIVSELKIALDYEAGGEIGKRMAKDLARLYTFVMDRLVEANLDRDESSLEAALDVLGTLKEGWDHAATLV